VYFNDHPVGRFLNLKNWNDGAPAPGATPTPARNRTVDWLANAAQYDNDFQELTIAGKARFTTDDKDTLESDSVTYKTNAHQVVITSPLKLQGHDGRLAITADRATADTQLEVFELGGKVTIDSRLGDGDRLCGSCPSLSPPWPCRSW
jgi:hypothetical protein